MGYNELLSEYKSLAGLDDAASEARKTEIIALLKKDGSEPMKAAAEKMIDDALDDIQDEVNDLKSQLNGTYELLPLAYIARTYFGKSRAWLYQRINGYRVRGRVYKLNDEQKRTFNQAVQDIAKSIGSVCIA